MNIFEQAKKNSTGKAGKKTEKREVVIIANETINQDIATLSKLEAKAKKINGEISMIKGQLKEVGIEEYTKLYKSLDKNPGSFIIQAMAPKKETSQYMFLPTDKYISIDRERATELKKQYGEEIVEEDTTYKFNSKLLEKYATVLSNLIGECDDIEDEDKANLIEAVTNYSVKKGTINDLRNSKNSKFDLGTMLDDIQPVYQIKNPEILED